jgi:preprotein translocase subunit SecG
MGILLAIHVIVTILLILIVLIQKNEGGSSLFATSGGSGMFNARGTSNVLTKATWILASIFIINCVVMAMIASSNIKNSGTLIEPENSADLVDPRFSAPYHNPAPFPQKKTTSNNKDKLVEKSTQKQSEKQKPVSKEQKAQSSSSGNKQK